MSDQEHKAELTSKLKEYMDKIDGLDIHPKNKLLIFQKYVLAKISWHLTVSKISTTWIKENLDNVVTNYMRSWLELPVSGTLKIAELSKKKYGLNFINISTRFTQCQLTFRNALKNSSNNNIRKVHEVTRKGTTLQVDSYVSTKDAIKKIRETTEETVREELSTQSLVIRSIWDQGCAKFNPKWCKVLDSLPRNIYSFVTRYLSNSLANGTNAVKWGIAQSSKCLFCNENQTLQHVVSACRISLAEKRWNWRHDSVLINIARFLAKIPTAKVYCDIENSEFLTPSVITGDMERPDIVVIKDRKCMLLELTVGFETNLEKNSKRKIERYRNLINRLKATYQVQYIDLSMGAIGVIGRGNKEFQKIFKTLGLTYLDFQKAIVELGLDANESSYLVRKIINICIRTTYFLFCQRNKKWEEPSLMAW